MINLFVKKNDDAGLFALRLTLGLLFLYGGLGKIIGSAVGGPGIEMFSGMVWGSIALAWIVAIVELAAGLMLILGFMSRDASVALIVILVVAILKVHNPFVDFGELMNFFVRLALIGGLLSVMFSGSGKVAINSD